MGCSARPPESARLKVQYHPLTRALPPLMCTCTGGTLEEDLDVSRLPRKQQCQEPNCESYSHRPRGRDGGGGKGVCRRMCGLKEGELVRSLNEVVCIISFVCSVVLGNSVVHWIGVMD